MPFKSRTKLVYDAQMSRKWQFRSRIRYKLSDQVKSLIANLLEPNPIIRWTVEEALIGDWFTDVPKLRNLQPDEFAALEEAQACTVDSKDVLLVKSRLNVSGSDVITTIKDVEELKEGDKFGSMKASSEELLQDDSSELIESKG